MSAKRFVLGVLTASCGTLLVGLAALVFGFVGIGRYLEDYCFTTLQCPLGTEAGCGGGPVEFRSPVSLQCMYDAGVVTGRVDPLPLLFGCAVAVFAVGVIGAIWWASVVRPLRLARADA